MARLLSATGADYRLVYAGRSRRQMAYLDDLVAEHGARLDVHVGDEGTSLSVPELVADCADARHRAVHVRADPIDGCGAPLLGRARSEDAQPAIRDLRQQRLARSSGIHVSIPRLGIEAVVGTDETMLEALEAAGADMMYDCRKGECGLCEVDVAVGAIDHRDVFYSDRQKDARGRMCCCVSRVVGAGTRQTRRAGACRCPERPVETAHPHGA